MTGADDDTGTTTLTGRALTGMQWTYFQTILSATLQIVVAGVMARLLEPADFGLVALATLSLRFVNYLARGGIAQALIQKPELDEFDIRASFTASVGLGLAFMAVIFAAAPLAATLLNTPNLTPVLRWMSLQLPLFSLGTVADALLRRELDFRALAIRSIISYVVGFAAVGLTLAIAGAGIWALVAAALSQTALRSLLTVVVRRHPVMPTTSSTAYRTILAFGSRVSVISFLEFLGTELDTLAVGRFLGAGPVGLYNRAYLLVKLPLEQTTTSLSAVLFPAFSSMQADVGRVRRGYLSAVQLTSAFTLPVAAGMAVAREELILTILGQQWIGAATVVPLIAFASALNVIHHLAAIVAEAKARLNPKLVISAGKLVVLASLLWLASDRSLIWFAAALAGADLVEHLAYTGLISRVLEVPVRTVLGRYVPSAAAAAWTAAAIFGVREVLTNAAVSVPVVLGAEIAAGALVVLMCLRWGPLRRTRDEALDRLSFAGVALPGTRGGRLIRGLLGGSARDLRTGSSR